MTAALDVAAAMRDGSPCAWCRRPMPAGLRRDAVCCSKRCRQARHRFTVGVGTASPVAGVRPRRLAYADPPYPGRAELYYGDHPDYGGEVDHAELVASLVDGYDAWALSTAADALQDVLAVCPPGVRVAAWHRGERENKYATGPLNAWEPVIYAGQFRRVAPARLVEVSGLPADGIGSPGGRDASRRSSDDASLGHGRRVDSFVFKPSARTTDPDRVVGAKPAAFWRWMFELLGATPADSFVDIFPASGGGSRAWETYTASAAVGSDA